MGSRLTLRPGMRGSISGWPGACRCATRTSRSWARATARRATRSTARTRGRTTGARAWVPPSTSPARAGRSSTRAGAATTRRSPTTSPSAPWGRSRPRRRTISTPELTRPVPDGVLAAGTTDHFRLRRRGPAQFANGSRSTYDDEPWAASRSRSAPALSLGVRYVHRSLGRVLEDYSQAPAGALRPRVRGPRQVQFLIGNINAGPETTRPTSIGVPQAFFEDPVHTYDAVELTARRASRTTGPLLASYRWSRLRGNYEGFYRGRQRAFRSRRSRRCSTSRPTTLATPRSARRSSVIGATSATRATTLGGPLPKRPHAPAQALTAPRAT